MVYPCAFNHGLVKVSLNERGDKLFIPSSKLLQIEGPGQGGVD